MTIREKIHNQIDEIDESVLPDLLKELKSFEARGRFSQHFWESVEAVKERNKDEDPDVILREVTEALNADRQNQHS